MESYRHTFEGHLEQLPAIHGFVDRASSDLGLGEDDAFACKLVIDEAATNAFEHAYDGRGGRVEVTLGREATDIVVCVRNWGSPFDPAAVAQPDLARPLEERLPGGLGIFLMHKFMDDVSFGFDARQGNTITMRRRLNRDSEAGE